jgi:phosphatidylethanolamine/phosphatidyl-N-methylethanolamine N-methyltransferase
MRQPAFPDALLFIRRFLNNPRQVGAVLPSTHSLGKAMVRNLQLASGDVVIEYGPGTGSLTQAIAQALEATPGTHYLGIEREAGFCEVLRRRFPSLQFAHGNVEDVAELLVQHKLPQPRAILSGLPLILLPNMEAIVRQAAATLAPGGEFRTFSYLQSRLTPMASRLRRLLRQHFASTGSSPLVWRNLPPAWVLRGTTALAHTASEPHSSPAA